MKHFILSVLLLTFCLAVSAQLDLYVSQTSGNDTNSGTSDDDAYATLSAAITASSDYNVTNPENQNVVIYISGGVYNVTGLNVVQNTQILYWDESDAPTVVNFQGNDKTKDTYFIVANTFVLNGDNGDGAISFRFDNLKTAISFDNTNATAVYTLSVLYTLFEEVYQGIYAVNVNQLLLQQSLFNSSYTADPINADGPGLGTDSNFEIDQTDFNNVAGVVNVENGYDEGILKDITWVGGTKGAFILVDGSWEVSDLNVTDATTGSTTSGAAIDFTNGIIEITDSHFTGCIAHNGGAVYLESVDASLTSVTFLTALPSFLEVLMLTMVRTTPLLPWKMLLSNPTMPPTMEVLLNSTELSSDFLSTMLLSITTLLVLMEVLLIVAVLLRLHPALLPLFSLLMTLLALLVTLEDQTSLVLLKTLMTSPLLCPLAMTLLTQTLTMTMMEVWFGSGLFSPFLLLL